MRTTFVFYANWYEAIKNLPREIQGEVLTAIIEYGLTGVTTESLKPIAKAVLALVKPQIDANLQKFENGKRGGRPASAADYGQTDTEPNRNQNETKTKPNQNQNETKTKPNQNQNETKTKPNQNQNETKTKPNQNQNETKTKPNQNQNETYMRNELCGMRNELCETPPNPPPGGGEPEKGKSKSKPQAPDLSFVDPAFAGTFALWVDYKRERRESYKSDRSLQAAYNKLLQLSGGDPARAAAVVEQSMANNWAGMFELKTERNGEHYNDTRQARRESVSRLASLAEEILAADTPTHG